MGGLSPDFVEEYCQDNLEDKSFIGDVVRFSPFFTNFNFDMMQAIVEEMNRYGESPRQAMEMLNTKIKNTLDKVYDVETYFKGVKIPDDEASRTAWTGVPFRGRFTAGNDGPCSPGGRVGSTLGEKVDVQFGPEHIISMDYKRGVIKYKQGEVEVILTERVDKEFDIWQKGIF